jgi:hypothetical protein
MIVITIAYHRRNKRKRMSKTYCTSLPHSSPVGLTRENVIFNRNEPTRSSLYSDWRVGQGGWGWGGGELVCLVMEAEKFKVVPPDTARPRACCELLSIYQITKQKSNQVISLSYLWSLGLDNQVLACLGFTLIPMESSSSLPPFNIYLENALLLSWNGRFLVENIRR